MTYKGWYAIKQRNQTKSTERQSVYATASTDWANVYYTSIFTFFVKLFKRFKHHLRDFAPVAWYQVFPKTNNLYIIVWCKVLLSIINKYDFKY